MSSIAVTTFSAILVDRGCVNGPVPGLLLIDHEADPDVGNRPSYMS